MVKTKLKQIAGIEDTETNIIIDYFAKELTIYTNRVSVMTRMEKLGYVPIKEEFMDKHTYSRTYKFHTNDIGKFLRTGIFAYNTSEKGNE